MHPKETQVQRKKMMWKFLVLYNALLTLSKMQRVIYNRKKWSLQTVGLQRRYGTVSFKISNVRFENIRKDRKISLVSSVRYACIFFFAPPHPTLIT